MNTDTKLLTDLKEAEFNKLLREERKNTKYTI